MRQASDTVRTELIPTFINENKRSRDAYFGINQRYFEGNVLHGQLVGSNDLENFIKDGTKDQFYQTTLQDVAKPRRSRGNIAGFEPLHPHYLNFIADLTFQAMDNAGSFDDEDGFFAFLCVVDCLFQLSHFCKDGSGRTGEDTLALLAQRHEYPLTFSLTGYRATLGGPDRLLFFRHVYSGSLKTRI